MNMFVRRWGNSAAVRLPASAMAAAGLKPDDPVHVREENGRIVIEPIRAPAPDLAGLIQAITPDNLHDGTDWGVPEGGEAW
jgi:antitoxin MazE